MYLRQVGYTIVPGHEEQAVSLCYSLARTLHERGLLMRLSVDGVTNTSITLTEQYSSLDEMHAAHAAMQSDDTYRAAIAGWAVAFYPLVQASGPAAIERVDRAA